MNMKETSEFVKQISENTRNAALSIGWAFKNVLNKNK
jgi:hypothetical protein